jgi:hypothetical protein
LLFVGGFQHTPNVDAMEFFLDDVLPRILTRLPEIVVHIVGSNLPVSLQQRSGPNVRIHGHLPDIRPLYAQVRVALAPLRYGAGVKGKINQSMAHGVPVVATTIAGEGMYLVPNQDVLLADTAAEFADAVVRLHEDEVLWQTLARGGQENVTRHFSFAAVERELVKAIGPELWSGQGVKRPLPRRPAAPYTMGTKVVFGQLGNAGNYAREGWALPESGSCWLLDGKASLDFFLPPGSRPRQVKARVFPYLAPPLLKQQRLRLAINGSFVPGETIMEGRAEPRSVSWDLEPGQVSGGHLMLTFICPDATSPLQLGRSADGRKLSFAFLELTVLSQTG